mmetsp:Transcript_13189/g.46152  ORF Transcript_13189/g.46152 Transcript_13189/m.46152 type:complete len:301 (-) Transcript_13189:49-951(-)
MAARRSFAPVKAAAASSAQIRALLDAVRGKERVLVVTGAGVSTDSGIPDYRSPGRPPHKPIQHNDFMGSAATRQRYWSRSFVGYPVLSAARPNSVHRRIAELQDAGRVAGLVTQNVDGLHLDAGSRDVLELHGNIHRVHCTGCGAVTARAEFQRVLREANPVAAEWLAEALGSESVHTRPDGDMDMSVPGGESAFTVPPCGECGGVLKPSVVFFGGTVPVQDTARGTQLAADCDAMLVLGSTLHVWSSFRLARAVAAAGKPLAILNFGDTRADAIATARVSGHLGTVVDQLADAWLSPGR